MTGEPKQARSATTSLVYLTVGALTVVWTIVWYIWLRRHEGTELQFLCCYGFFFSGIVLMALPLGLFVAVYALNPEYVMLLFTTSEGRKMVGMAIFMQIIGAIVIKKIVNIKV